MLGSILGGNYTDNYGRKNAITLFSLLLGCALIVHGFMPAKFEVFAIFRIIESVFLSMVQHFYSSNSKVQSILVQSTFY